jgi:hypothetical protein
VALLPFFEFCEHSAVGEAIRASSWLFPVVESFHLLGLVVIGGSVLVVDMRLRSWASQPTGGATGERRSALACRQPGCDAYFGRTAFLVGGDKVSLQPGVSSENDIFAAGNPLHVFGAQQSHRNR